MKNTLIAPTPGMEKITAENPPAKASVMTMPFIHIKSIPFTMFRTKLFSPFTLVLLWISCLTLQPLNAQSQTTPQYNVLFISIDDLNSRLDFMGNPEVPTPNLQRLVNRGMIFNNAYCQYQALVHSSYSHYCLLYTLSWP